MATEINAYDALYIRRTTRRGFRMSRVDATYNSSKPIR
jgi:hypothetical protein